MTRVRFTVRGSPSVVIFEYPGIPKRGERVVWDDAEFIVVEDGVVHYDSSNWPISPEVRAVLGVSLDD